MLLQSSQRWWPFRWLRLFKKIVMINKSPVVAQRTIKPESPCGTVELMYAPDDISRLGKKAVVSVVTVQQRK